MQARAETVRAAILGAALVEGGEWEGMDEQGEEYNSGVSDGLGQIEEKGGGTEKEETYKKKVGHSDSLDDDSEPKETPNHDSGDDLDPA